MYKERVRVKITNRRKHTQMDMCERCIDNLHWMARLADSTHRQLVRCVIFHDEARLVGGLITPSALVESERPERRQPRIPDELGVLCNHIGGCRAQEHKKVEHTANDLVLKRAAGKSHGK